jgi:hypothetical protein
MATVTLDLDRLVAVLASADGRCPNCTLDLAEAMQELDPTVDWVRLVEAKRVELVGF